MAKQTSWATERVKNNNLTFGSHISHKHSATISTEISRGVSNLLCCTLTPKPEQGWEKDHLHKYNHFFF